MRYFCSLLLFVAIGVNLNGEGGVRGADTLKPADLGIIQKEFFATHGPDEVVVFRVKHYWEGELEKVVSGISHFAGQEVVNAVQLTNLGFFRGSLVDDPQRSGLYRLTSLGSPREIREQYMRSASWTQGEKDASGIIAQGYVTFHKQTNPEQEGCHFVFELFTLTYTEAKELYPNLPDLEPNRGWRYVDTQIIR